MKKNALMAGAIGFVGGLGAWTAVHAGLNDATGALRPIIERPSIIDVPTATTPATGRGWSMTQVDSTGGGGINMPAPPVSTVSGQPNQAAICASLGGAWSGSSCNVASALPGGWPRNVHIESSRGQHLVVDNNGFAYYYENHYDYLRNKVKKSFNLSQSGYISSYNYLTEVYATPHYVFFRHMEACGGHVDEFLGWDGRVLFSLGSMGC